MTPTRYSLLLVVLALPLFVGCGSGAATKPDASEVESYFQSNPAEPATDPEDVPPPS